MQLHLIANHSYSHSIVPFFRKFGEIYESITPSMPLTRSFFDLRDFRCIANVTVFAALPIHIATTCAIPIVRTGTMEKRDDLKGDRKNEHRKYSSQTDT